MSMNWHQRRHGWSCDECGMFNDEGNFNCDSEECEMDRKREVREYERRGLVHRYRQQFRDECVMPALIGPHRYRARRYVGGTVRYRVMLDRRMGYSTEWYRLPASVHNSFHAYFGT